MAAIKKNKKKEADEEEKADLLWRRPITLDTFEEEDPLATLYRGGEVGAAAKKSEDGALSEDTASVEKKKDRLKTDKETNQTSKPPASMSPVNKQPDKKSPRSPGIEEKSVKDKNEPPPLPKISEAELKSMLRIKSDVFEFTDIREILRGKSFDIYAYLRFLAGEKGVCKIKHQDMMKKLDISRPTLFKQGDWLVRLSLIEKRNVPGDHLGTSYTVHRPEDVLPVSSALFDQIQSEIENYAREAAGK